MTSLNLSSYTQSLHGIYVDLDEAFDFNRLVTIRTKNEFLNMSLMDLSAKSKKFLVRSSEYFDSDGKGQVDLLQSKIYFTTPKMVMGIDLSMQLPSVSFTAWVRLDEYFSGGYIIRKKMAVSGTGSLHSCWGWYLNRLRGQQLHYGAHDYFPAKTEVGDGIVQQEEVAILESEIPQDKSVFLTTVISDSHAMFYQGVELLGSVLLPRRVTDCLNTDAHVLVGDSGFELYQVSSSCDVA